MTVFALIPCYANNSCTVWVLRLAALAQDDRGVVARSEVFAPLLSARQGDGSEQFLHCLGPSTRCCHSERSAKRGVEESSQCTCWLGKPRQCGGIRE